MIARLTGTLADTGADWAVLDVGGVGYLVHCSAKTLAALGETGGLATVHTELLVSENDLRLVGFASAAEREWFRLLNGVQGVGSKMALAVLSALTIEELQRACAGGDAARRASGRSWRRGSSMSSRTRRGSHRLRERGWLLPRDRRVPMRSRRCRTSASSPTLRRAPWRQRSGSLGTERG